MTDETREQIKKDADEWSDNHAGSSIINRSKTFQAGATHQHPIAYSQGLAEGRRQAIEKIERLANGGILYHDAENPSFKDIYRLEVWRIVLKELEKLKQ